MTTPLRVLMIGHSYVVAQNQTIPAAIARRPGVEVTLVAPTFHYGDLRRIRLERREHPDYRIVPLRARLTRWNHVMWYDPLGLRRVMRDASYDVIYVWEEPYTVPGYQIARAAPRGDAQVVFFTFQSLMKRYPWPFSHFERAVVRRSAGWVAGGQLVYDVMTARGYPPKTGRVITLGVDMHHFRPASRDAREATRRELGIASPVIGFVGRLVRDKGLDVLMQALEGVRGRWSLFALGSGPYEAKLLEWATRHGWRDRLRIQLATHDEVPRYLGAMDLLVAPSQTMPNWKEQFGRMLVEAFACKLAVVGSDSGEIPYVIGDAGLVVGETDVAGWTRAIQDLVENDAKRAQLAERGFARCRQRYDVEAVAQAHLDFYRELAGR